MAYHFERDQTTDEVLGNMGLTGKRALVTGAGGGLGLETSRALAVCGAEIVGTARDLEKARAAVAAVIGDVSGSVELTDLDLASLQSLHWHRRGTNARTLSVQSSGDESQEREC